QAFNAAEHRDPLRMPGGFTRGHGFTCMTTICRPPAPPDTPHGFHGRLRFRNPSPLQVKRDCETAKRLRGGLGVSDLFPTVRRTSAGVLSARPAPPFRAV